MEGKPIIAGGTGTLLLLVQRKDGVLAGGVPPRGRGGVLEDTEGEPSMVDKTTNAILCSRTLYLLEDMTIEGLGVIDLQRQRARSDFNRLKKGCDSR